MQNKPSIFNKKKLNRADYMFASKKNETLTKKPWDVNGLDFRIKDLDECVVQLFYGTAQL